MRALTSMAWVVVAACTSGAPVERLGDGAACARDDQCTGGACVTEDAGRVCATSCDEATSCRGGRCTTRVDGSSLRLICGGHTGERFFAEACASDESCRSGVCHEGFCTSPCGACPSQFRCVPATLSRGEASLDHGVCTTWPEPATLELGPADVGASPASLEFDVPTGVAAFTLVLEDFDGLAPSIARLVAPDGAVVISGLPGATGAGDGARCVSAPGLATALVPGSDAPSAAVQAGRYHLELRLFEPTSFPRVAAARMGTIERVAAVLKPARRAGRVDVLLQVAPETQLRAPDGGFAGFVPTLASRLDEVLRAKTGLALGRFDARHLVADAGAVVDTVAAANVLWAGHSAAVARARSINVMLVPRVGFAGGLSGTSPGAPGVYGRGGTGVVIEPLSSGPAATAVLLAHELLHYAGLMHTSDAFWGPDLVADTPSCVDPNGSGCPDERNLMFPSFPTREPLTFSSGQMRVLEGSPWPYEVLHPGACGDADVVGFSDVDFISGTTVGEPRRSTGTCGGAGPERVHLLRLDGITGKVEVTAVGLDGPTVVHVHRVDCDGVEVACARPDGGSTASATFGVSDGGVFFVVVDGDADGGRYRLTRRALP